MSAVRARSSRRLSTPTTVRVSTRSRSTSPRRYRRHPTDARIPAGVHRPVLLDGTSQAGIVIDGGGAASTEFCLARIRVAARSRAHDQELRRRGNPRDARIITRSGRTCLERLVDTEPDWRADRQRLDECGRRNHDRRQGTRSSRTRWRASRSAVRLPLAISWRATTSAPTLALKLWATRSAC